MGTLSIKKSGVAIVLGFVLIALLFLSHSFVLIDGKPCYVWTNRYENLNIDASDEDLANICQLKNLETLILHSFRITNIDFIDGMSDLKFIMIDSPKISDYTVFRNCSSLEYVYLHTTNVTDLDAFTHTPKLKALEIDQCEMLSNLDSLRALQELETLCLVGENITDISAIGELHELSSLTLRNTSICDISPLFNCGKLKYLNLYGNESLVNLQDIHCLDQLEEINLSGTSVMNYNDLLNISSLKRLTISREIYDLPIFDTLRQKGIEVIAV